MADSQTQVREAVARLSDAVPWAIRGRVDVRPDDLRTLLAAYTTAEADLAEASPNDLRALGWAVAVHNDYRLNGEAHTFWLLTKDGRAIKGEGRTDAEALAQVRALAAFHNKGEE